ncbi:kelch-like protein 13 [Mya arenaria]|uniref:kelch-like protein 13 n=1 Tax=Mya arenaria TaxID=6604 RepID=UPI0022E8B643|nr:kelch-like protein 13 [Mya arenaria]XP_052762709.1 kelch-like protein 13 [Mya arenaria]
MSGEQQSKSIASPSSRGMDMCSSVAVNKAVMKQLYNQMLKQSNFCDTTVSFGEGDNWASMKAHWCVLVHSPYFQSMYRSGLREKQQGEVHIGIGKPEFVKMALTYLYTGKIFIEYSTIKDMLEVADYLQIDSLKADCSRYIRDVELTVENCLSLCFITSLYNIEGHSEVLEFIRAHLPEVMSQPEALKMSSDLVNALLSDPTLSYVPREDLFNFLIKWIEFDPEIRTKHFEDMFSLLDLSRMSLQFLTNVVNRCKFVKASEKCAKTSLEVEQVIRNGRGPVFADIDVLIVGGSLQNGDEQMFIYLIKENRWVPLSTLCNGNAVCVFDLIATVNCKGDELYYLNEEPRFRGPDGLMKFNKYNFKTKKSSSHEVPFKDNVDIRDGAYLAGIFALKEFNEICVITHNYMCNTSGNNEPAMVHAVFFDAEMSRIVSKTLVFKTFNPHAELLLSCCLARDRYLCVYVFNNNGGSVTNNEYQKFFVLDTHKKPNNEFQDFSRGSYRGDVIFPVGREIYVCTFINSSDSIGRFDLKKGKWSVFESPALHGIDENICGLGFFDNKVFAFIGDDEDIFVEECKMFDFKGNEWVPVAPLPRPLSCSIESFTVLSHKISSQYLTCHADCPHCKLAVLKQ